MLLVLHARIHLAQEIDVRVYQAAGRQGRRRHWQVAVVRLAPGREGGRPRSNLANIIPRIRKLAGKSLLIPRPVRIPIRTHIPRADSKIKLVLPVIIMNHLDIRYLPPLIHVLLHGLPAAGALARYR